MKKVNRYLLACLSLFTACKTEQKQAGHTTHKTQKPNIVLIYLDDLGYGDVSANGATAIQTPHIDRIANEGVRFTNGHSSSATSTPSRYAMLTGTYPWRANAQILPGSAPLIIGTEQMTMAKMLKAEGYQTAIIGKWHLGLGDGIVDWNKEIKPGPNQVGFDHSYIMAATQDRVPTVYIEDGHVVNLDPTDPIKVNYKHNFKGQPTGKKNPELTTMKWHHGHNNTIINGIPRMGYMKGGKTAIWKDEDMADHFLGKVQDYVKTHKEKPFFLCYTMQEPHVPRTPHPRFVGKSGMGSRGDVILEADWVIGEFMKTLEQEGLLENTLIVFSSDNGPVLNDGYYDEAVEKLGNHTPMGIFRGGKYSLYEAGTRVPFFTYWKGKIKPTVSNALVCQMDLLSSIAQLVGSEVRTADSQELLSTFMGQTQEGREHLIIEATTRTALLSGDWALIPPYKGNPMNKEVNIEIGNSSEYQLFNLKEDPSQQHNLAKELPEKLTALIKIYQELKGV